MTHDGTIAPTEIVFAEEAFNVLCFTANTPCAPGQPTAFATACKIHKSYETE